MHFHMYLTVFVNAYQQPLECRDKHVHRKVEPTAYTQSKLCMKQNINYITLIMHKKIWNAYARKQAIEEWKKKLNIALTLMDVSRTAESELFHNLTLCTGGTCMCICTYMSSQEEHESSDSWGNERIKIQTLEFFGEWFESPCNVSFVFFTHIVVRINTHLSERYVACRLS